MRTNSESKPQASGLGKYARSNTGYGCHAGSLDDVNGRAIQVVMLSDSLLEKLFNIIGKVDKEKEKQIVKAVRDNTVWAMRTPLEDLLEMEAGIEIDYDQRGLQEGISIPKENTINESILGGLDAFHIMEGNHSYFDGLGDYFVQED